MNCNHYPHLPVVDKENGNVIGWACECRQHFESCPHGQTRGAPEIWRELLAAANEQTNECGIHCEKHDSPCICDPGHEGPGHGCEDCGWEGIGR